jgi:hypothetical protein
MSGGNNRHLGHHASTTTLMPLEGICPGELPMALTAFHQLAALGMGFLTIANRAIASSR